ncbi:Zinc finger protein 473 [Eumeta japonica]|uniref:Zinc finger protein 473 n=1 Tax=Eumeta variegata TaxID=151549 RepID=A0A4C1U321_EUMVA|nr:Zinc finger protein 473 [Eumeta japonica]
MAAIKELCRLCGKPDVNLKDMIDEENNNILKLVRDLIKVEITKTDVLSSKICGMCEDTIISFQMFILQCKKIQEAFEHSLSVDNDVTVKLENSLNHDVPEVKPEVKLEFPGEVIDFEDDAFECSMSDDGSNFEPSAGEETYLPENHEYSPPKKGKRRKIKRSIDEDDKNKLDEVLKKRKFKLNDFIKLKCHICEEEFPKWPSLRAHLSKVHKSTPLVFCLCGEGLSSKSVLYKHVSDHKIESKKLYSDLNDDDDDDCPYSKLNVNDFIKCDKCPKVTKTAAAMEKHKMKHLPPSERHFKCSGCDKVFNTKDAMKSHERSHIPIEERKIYSCEICNLKFTTRSSAAGHKRVVHCKIKSYVCDLCGYACGTGGELRQHRAIHSEDRPFVCSKCSKSMYHQWLLMKRKMPNTTNQCLEPLQLGQHHKSSAMKSIRVLRHMPEGVYASGNDLFYINKIILSQAEVQQGDSLVSLLFSSAIHKEAPYATNVARLKAVFTPEYRAWLHKLPSSNFGRLLDNSLRVAVALRLNCNVCSSNFKIIVF